MREKLLEILEEEFRKNGILELEYYTASNLSEKLNVSRNLVSQYLNEYVDKEIIFKVNTRPVYFFQKFYFEKKYNCEIKEKIISKEKFLTLTNNKKNFENLIGFDGSLNYIIEQCKGATCYPEQGLPILIYGETGTGKSLLAKEVYEYGKNIGIFKENAPFVTLNCSEFADNSNLLTANLFGHTKGAFTGATTDNQGLIKSAENGVLFLDEVHCLKAECQEKLFLFMDQGIYHMLGDNKNWQKSKVHLIFATTKKPEEALLKTLLRRIPIVIKMPSLEERPIVEKSELIKFLIAKEEYKIGKEIKMSSVVYETLLNHSFKGNIGHLKNCIKASCANAYIDSIKEEVDLNIKMYNLPEYIIENKEINLSADTDSTVYNILRKNDKKPNYLKKPIISLLENIIEVKIDDTRIREILNNYFDLVVFKDEKNPKKKFIKNIVINIFENLKITYGVTIYHNTLIAITNLLFDIVQNKLLLSQWESINKEKLEKVKEGLKESYFLEFKISNYILNIMNKNIEFENKSYINILLILIIKVFSVHLTNEKTPCIIICHGYSTASSIADATNKLLDKYIFDAIDMPLDISTNTIVKKLEEYFLMRPHITESILLVDMGSLEQIYTRINASININLGIINNITTRLALEIGEKLLEGVDMETTLKEACKNNMSNYKLIKNSKKGDVLIVACSSGEGTAIKIKELLLKSFPKKINLKIIPSDYRSLNSDKTKHILNLYNTEYIIGTLNPKIKNLKYVPLERIINLNNEDILNIFSKYLDSSEIEIFKENLLKNFSIYNLLDHLTILNPEKVLTKVKEGVDKLQKVLKLKLKPNTIIGLYIHISCLIERLITKNKVKTYDELEKLKKEKEEILKVIKECFSVIEDVYSVEIPDIEIAYIYEYIKND